MIVAVCSGSYGVATSLYTMAAKNGFSVQKLGKYDFNAIKGSDYCILDLDNLKEYFDDIKRDAVKIPEVIIVGISRNEDILDSFRPVLFDVVQKQFLEKHFNSYIDDVIKNSGASYVINKEDERIYDKCGVKLSNLLNPSILSSDDYLDRLRAQIAESKTPIKSEDEFFQDIDIDSIPVPEAVPLVPVVVYEDPFVDNALLMYRTRKLKSLNLSAVQIEEKLRILTERSISENKPAPGTSSSELLSKLKSGYFRNRPAKKVPPAIPPKKEEPKLEEIPAVISKDEPKSEEKIITAPKKELTTEIPSAEAVTEHSDIDKKYDLDFEEESKVEQTKQGVGVQQIQKPIEPTEPGKKEIVAPTVKEPEPVLEISQDKQSIIEETKQTLDVTLSPEKEELLGERLARLQSLRKQKPKPKAEPVVEAPKPEPIVKLEPEPESEIVKSVQPKKKEESLDDRYDMSKAISRLRGASAPSSDKKPQETIKRNSKKGLEEKLPGQSLFDELKARADAVPREDKETQRERRKREVDKKSKPPRR